MDRGGAETMVMNYYRQINRELVQFDFLVHRQEKGAYEEEIEKLGGHIYRLCPIRPWNMTQYIQMIRQFFDEHPEYTIIHSHMSEMGYFIVREARKRGIHVRICHAHNAQHTWDLKMLMRLPLKHAIRSEITHRFACSREAGEWLYGSRSTSDIIYLKNAIDTEKYRYNKSIRQAVRKEFHLENKLVIGHVGRFVPQKNHSFVVKIFAEVLKIYPDAVLLLIGDGPDAKTIQTLTIRLNIRDHVIFLQRRDDVNRLLQGMDLFLFPSRYEGLSLALIEAQAAGLLCVTSDVISSESIITQNVVKMSIKKSAFEWAIALIIALSAFDRKDCTSEVEENGFEIHNNVKWLEDFYCNV